MTQAATPEAPDIVTRAMAGDTEAFGILYGQYHGFVCRFIWRRTGNHTVAEDLASDVFVRVLRKIGKFEWQGTDIGAWFLAIARNVIADYYRSARYQREILVSGADAALGDTASGDFEARPDEVVIDHMMTAGLLGLLPQLTPEQSEVLRLRFLEDLSTAETAARLGIPEGSVEARQYRATRSLAQAWYAEERKGNAAR